jgi:hypothetical protein
MSSFINIRDNGKKPLLIDAENVSVVIEMYKDASTGTKEDGISFSSKDEDHYLYLDTKSHNIDTDKCIKKLSASGNDLFEFPYVWPDQGEVGRIFVNPSAFSHIITSAPEIEKGKTEETVGMIMGVDGHGIVESYGVPLKTVNKFIKLVNSANPDLVSIDPNKGISRFYKPGETIYDPKKISRIYQNGYDFNIRFNNGGEIDLSLVDRNFGQVYLDVKYNNLTEAEKNKITDAEKGKLLDTKKIYAFERKMRSRVSREFARAVAKDAPQLVKLNNTEGVFYTTFNNVSSIIQYDKSLKFNYKKNTPDSSGHGHSPYFKSAEAASKELKRLNKFLNSGPKQP